jgi:hypothetical protein
MAPVLKRVAVAAVPCLLVLSGCGVAGTEFNPGVAAYVGDETVSTGEVDELTTSYCGAVETQVREGGQRFPLAVFKSGIAAQLALRSAAEQIADEFGVTPSSEYRTQLAQIDQQAEDSGYTGEERDAYVQVQATQPLAFDLLTQVGRIQLEAEGQADPTVDFQQARGLDELAAWSEREGIEFNPRYGLEIVDGAPQPADTDVSLAVSELAKGGQSQDEPPAEYVASLPAAAVCG